MNITPEKEQLLRDYVALKISWSELRTRGFDNFVQVLSGLGQLGLRQPIAPMEGANLAARQKGNEIMSQLLENAK